MVDWNVKTPSLWDWDNQLPFDSGCKLPSNGGGDGRSGGAGSELANCSSSKGSFSVATDSSSRVGKEPSSFNFEGYPDKNKYLLTACASLAFTARVGSEESLIGLKLGKRTYFEEVNVGSDAKKIVSSSGPVTASPALAKKPRVPNHSLQRACCQVEGCNDDLSLAKDYHRKHRVCEKHTKCPRVIVAGQERRFCQQCSRFHDLSEFDQKKRSCRRRLSDHNARRRKPQPDIISLSSSSFSLSDYDEEQMNLLWNKPANGYLKSNISTLWNSYDFKPQSLSGRHTTKAEDFAAQLHASEILQNSFCYIDNHLPLKGSTVEVLNQGSEASIEALSICGAPDFRRALSLLSNSSWLSPNSGHASLFQLPVVNSTSSSPSFMDSLNSTSHHWPIASSQDHQTRGLSFEMLNNGSHLPKIQMEKETYGTTLFYSNQIN